MGLVIGIIVAVIVVLLVLWLIVGYNGLIRARNAFKNAFAQIDVQLQRRFDLIPNLVETAKAYMAHERQTLEAVTQARGAAMSGLSAAQAKPGDPAAMQQLAQTQGALASALGRFTAVAEAYPDLKANQNMMQVSEELTSTENKVAFARQAYNDSVMSYNNKRETFPTSVLAGMFHFTPAAQWEIAPGSPEVRDAPKVQFSNFFERQHAARGSTVKLVVLFVLAVVTIVAVIDLLVAILARNQPVSSVLGFVIAASIATLIVISLGTLTKMLALRAGGAAVAQSVGAVPIDPTTSDPQLRRFVNVVEEMSIASGVPVPRLFVLEQEDGINAFAAGYSPADAAITVTAGALHRLNRDELQGVIGHEFSHVLNGDMRLNVRLIGLLNGILLLGLVGLRFLQFGGGRSNSKKGNPLAVIAIALLILGFVGQFFAGLIQAAVSRQREWLADASSVQFTRQTSGLVGALKKIAGLPVGSTLHDSRSQKQISHMLFGDGTKSVSRLYATHPPLAERIKALDPSFDPSKVPDASQSDGLAEDAASGFAAPPPTPPPSGPTRIEPSGITARVATFSPADLQRGREIAAQLPPQAKQLATQPATAVPLVLALLLDGRADVRDRQLAMVAHRLGPGAASATAGLAAIATAVPPILRLPLVAVAAPVLAAAPMATRAPLIAALQDVAAADGAITLFEYCLTRLVAAYLRDSGDPSGRSRPGRTSLQQVQPAALTLLAVVAAAGNADPGAAAHAFATAVDDLLPGAHPHYVVPPDCAAALDPGWDALDALEPQSKQALIEAIVVAIRDDGVVEVAEAELLRTACALLRCPLPAVLG